MFGPSHRRELADIERRMQLLERRFERLGQTAARTATSGYASAAQATDRLGDTLLSTLSELAARFRGGARGVGSEAARFGLEAARLGQDASRLSGEALRRVATGIERHPLMVVAIAAGIGILIGLGGRRH